jgi:glutamate 5-kinase
LQDTVAVQELRFGDNDTLSAQVATLVGANWLFLLTDVDGLYTCNPKSNPDAKPIREVRALLGPAAGSITAGSGWQAAWASCWGLLAGCSAAGACSMQAPGTCWGPACRWRWAARC